MGALRRAAAVPLLALLGCTGIIPGVSPHDLRYDAEALERDRCDRAPVDPHIYGRDAISKVEPYYRHVMGGPNGTQSHLAGAELEVRPSPGVTQELLERGLMCHAAQAMLGRVPTDANDPYFLPDVWVKVDVRSGGGVFLVTVAPEDARRAKEVLDRATAYAAPSMAR